MGRRGHLLSGAVGVFVPLLVFMLSFTLKGCMERIDLFETVSTPDISVTQESKSIPHGSGSFNFGAVKVRDSRTATFTVQNGGAVTLAISGASVNGDDQFTMGLTSLVSVVKGGNSTSFVLTYAPTRIGDSPATVRLESNDPDTPVYTFTVTGYGEPSAVSVTQGGTALPNGNSSFYFPPVTAGYDGSPFVFDLENIGPIDLLFSSVAIVSGDVFDFDLSAPPLPRYIPPDGAESFSIAFTPRPGVTGTREALVSIENDAQAESPYTFTVRGEALVPIPDISVEQDGVECPVGSEFDGFGNVTVGTSGAPVVFTVRNEGTAELAFTTVNSKNLDEFETNLTGTDLSLSPGEFTQFSITFMPNATGERLSLIEIPNNDPDEDPYFFTVSGYGTAVPAPEIYVRRGGTLIPSGSQGYDFGSILLGYSSTSVTFAIYNSGNATLNIGGITSDRGEFTLAAPSTPFTIAPGANRTFTVAFTPSAAETVTGTLRIANNDSDENPYLITVRGTGQVPAPNMRVLLGATQIPDGTALARDFGGFAVGATSDPVIFTIDNTAGTAVLNIQDIYLPDSVDFTIGFEDFTNSVPPGGTTAFTVRFTPLSTGPKSGTVTIVNNDPVTSKNPYTFRVAGTGLTPPNVAISVSADSVPCPHESTCTFGNVVVGSSLTKTFTVLNEGPEDLVINNIVKTTGTATTEFSLDFSATVMNQPIPQGSSTSFDVTFAPSALAVFSRELEINSNASQSPYKINLTGTGRN